MIKIVKEENSQSDQDRRLYDQIYKAVKDSGVEIVDKDYEDPETYYLNSSNRLCNSPNGWIELDDDIHILTTYGENKSVAIVGASRLDDSLVNQIKGIAESFGYSFED